MSRIIEITDFNKPELDAYACLSERQLLNRDHPEQGMFIAESPKVIERALDAGYEAVVIILIILYNTFSRVSNVLSIE